MDLNGKSAIVTGASSGLGLATARVFAEAGAGVMMMARNRQKLAEASDLVAAAGGDVRVFAGDVGDAGSVAEMVKAAVDHFGRVDILVNNAAIDHPGPITELTVDQWDQIVAVNLSGVFYACKAVFPQMVTQGGGLIFNISSVAGRRGWAGATAYCATKFALTGFTQALVAEGRPHNIRCSLIYPGGMDTGWHAERHEEFLDPHDVGRFLLHLATQEPRFTVPEAIVTPLNEQGYP